MSESDRDKWFDEPADQDLDRLIDGEVSIAELRRMVERFDREPHRWRRCALAFLEAQALHQELTALSVETGLADRDIGDPVPESTETRDSSKRESPAAAFDGSGTSPPPTSLRPAVEKEGTRPLRQSRWLGLGLVAASLFVAFGLGLYGRTVLFAPEGGWWSAGDSDVAGLGGPSSDDGPRNDPTGTTLVGSSDPAPRGRLQLEVGGPREQGPSGEIEVPFYAGSSLPPPSSVGVSEDSQRWLADSGLQIRTQRQVIPVPADNGSTVLVPIETFEFVPADQRRFQ